MFAALIAMTLIACVFLWLLSLQKNELGRLQRLLDEALIEKRDALTALEEYRRALRECREKGTSRPHSEEPEWPDWFEGYPPTLGEKKNAATPQTPCCNSDRKEAGRNPT